MILTKTKKLHNNPEDTTFAQLFPRNEKFTKLNLIKKSSKRVTRSATRRHNIEPAREQEHSSLALIYEKCAKSGEFLFRSQVFWLWKRSLNF